MTATAPIALEMIEDAIHDWVAAATGIPGNRVCLLEKRDDGAPDVALPAALFYSAGPLIRISQPEIRKVPSIVQQRVTIRVEGPGEFGVNLYVGFGSTATPISYTSPDDEQPSEVAAGLLAQLASDLPAGITAAVDPDDDASLIVTGSNDVPMFALAPVDGDQVLITPLRERFPELECEWSRMVWRVELRGAEMRGFGTGMDLMARAKKAMHRILAPKLHLAGWRLAGVLFAAATPPTDRSESPANLDFAIEGYATAAYQVPAARQIGVAFTAA